MKLLYKRCPNCGRVHIETHGEQAGDFLWQLCRDCGWNTPREDEPNNDK